MKQYKTQYGTIFAVKEHNGAPAIMCRAELSETWSLSSMIAPYTPGAWTAEELQSYLDNWAATKGWKPVDESPACLCVNCTCTGCHEECYGHCHGCGHPVDHCNSYQTEGEKRLRQNKEDAPCNEEQPAPTGDAAATMVASAVPMPSTAAETLNASPAKEGDASSSRSAEPAPQAPAASPLSAPDTAPMSLPAFDYTGLDAQTVQDLHLAEREFAGGKRMAEIGLRRMADGVAIAHDALCGTDATLCRNGDGTFTAPEKTFGRWCESIGLNRKAAERLLQVSKLFDQSSPRQQKALEELGPTLLYAAAKPSAPAELVQAVKDGDITTNKQYQDLLARYNAEKAAREQAEHERDEAATHIQAARDMQIDTARERDAALKEKAALARDCNRLGLAAEKAQAERDTALRRAAEAEKQRDGARDALQAAKLRGDKLKAENDALKAQPVEAQVVDEEEINRRAQARADELTAPLREELEALRSRHPADPEEAEQAIRDAYDSAVYTGRVIESAWRSLCPLLPRMDADRRELALNQIVKIVSTIQGECIKCL